MIRYLHLDCEMGGREIEYSLLTAFFLVTDHNFNVLGDLSLAVKPDDGNYLVSGQGMSVNKIDLINHDRVAIPYKDAKSILYKFLSSHTNNGKDKLTPVGHGVKGDIEHITDKLISVGSWEQHCTYHYIDTSVVLQFLRACGKMPMDIDGSVSGLVKHFDIPTLNSEWHDAQYDTTMTMLVYKEMVKLGK